MQLQPSFCGQTDPLGIGGLVKKRQFALLDPLFWLPVLPHARSLVPVVPVKAAGSSGYGILLGMYAMTSRPAGPLVSWSIAQLIRCSVTLSFYSCWTLDCSLATGYDGSPAWMCPAVMD